MRRNKFATSNSSKPAIEWNWKKLITRNNTKQTKKKPKYMFYIIITIIAFGIGIYLGAGASDNVEYPNINQSKSITIN